MSWDFANRVALVTGASSGIGLATAVAFGRAGARVVLSDVDTERGERAAHEVERAGGRAIFVRCDVADMSQVDALIERAVKEFGRLDCAFNNAGISGPLAPAADYPPAEWNRVIAVNLTGVWLCMRAEIPRMVAQGGGAIVNCASILGHVGFANAAAYTAAKHGVIGLTQTAAIEYAPRGVRINAVCPAFIATPMLERAGLTTDPKMLAQIEALHPVHRLGRPNEVADAVLWLSSAGSSFVTGHPLLVDGGYVAQ